MQTAFTANNKLFNPSSNYKMDVRESGRYLNLKVTMDGTSNPKLTTMQFTLKGAGRR